jgi:hypothetical protein
MERANKLNSRRRRDRCIFALHILNSHESDTCSEVFVATNARARHQDSSIVTVTDWTHEESAFDSWKGQEIILFSIASKTDSGVQPASCPLGTSGFSEEAKRSEREFNNSTPSDTKFKNAW